MLGTLSLTSSSYALLSTQLDYPPDALHAL